MRILGVDEAGRGCVLGPLVIAGVLVDEKGQSELSKIGVKDSKLLSPSRRVQLAKMIDEIAIRTHLVKLAPAKIDKVVSRGRRLHKLNRLEAQTMAAVIQVLNPDIAIVDASDVLPDRYRKHVEECLSHPIPVISEHKADLNYPVVSAASIIAKVERDRNIAALRVRFGDFGSGYMTDPKTSAFLEVLAKTHSPYPDFVRRSWKPAKQARRNAKTTQALLHESAARV